MSYNNKKKERAEEAQWHTRYMDENYKKQTIESIKRTKIYEKDVELGNRTITRIDQISVVPMDSVSAIFKYAKDSRAMVLNFASYRHAGGNFINGSRAQEESLCLESNLYNILKEHQSFYDENSKHPNKSLYTNRALYTKKVVFLRDFKTQYCDVLTCASPNYHAASSKVSKEENTKALKDRIKFVIKIALNNNVDTLILGAFGCGVFGQDPIEVASIFKEIIGKYCNRGLRIVFAIPEGNNDNLNAFRKVFS